MPVRPVPGACFSEAHRPLRPSTFRPDPPAANVPPASGGPPPHTGNRGGLPIIGYFHRKD